MWIWVIVERSENALVTNEVHESSYRTLKQHMIPGRLWPSDARLLLRAGQTQRSAIGKNVVSRQ